MDPTRPQRRDWSKVDRASDAEYFLDYLRQASVRPWAQPENPYDEPCVAVVARNDPEEQEHVIPFTR